MDSIELIYQENILDHYKNPRNFGKINNESVHHHEYNPLCGDEIDLYLVIDNNKKIVYFSFGFENIENSNDRNLIMSRIVQDFDIDIDAPAIINANPASGFGLDINTTNVTLTIKTNEFAEKSGNSKNCIQEPDGPHSRSRRLF